MFSRQHYRAIAEVLRANRPRYMHLITPRRSGCSFGAIGHHRHIVDQIANMFQQDNERFDVDKFLEAVQQ